MWSGLLPAVCWCSALRVFLAESCGCDLLAALRVLELRLVLLLVLCAIQPVNGWLVGCCLRLGQRQDDYPVDGGCAHSDERDDCEDEGCGAQACAVAAASVLT